MTTLLAVLAVLAVGAAGVGLIQRDWTKKHWSGSGGGGPFGPIDEIFAPTRHESMVELKQQYDRTAPAPVPGEPPWLDVDLDDGRRGSVTIRPDSAPEPPGSGSSKT